MSWFDTIVWLTVSVITVVKKIYFLGSFYVTNKYIQKLVIKFVFVNNKEYLLALNYLLNVGLFWSQQVDGHSLNR